MEFRSVKFEPNEETTMTPQRSTGRGLLIALAAMAVTMLALTWAAITHAQTANTAVITFTAPTTRTDGSTIAGALSYEVWQGLKGATKTKVGTITSIRTTISTGLAGGNEYCWDIVAIEAGNPTTSAHSAEACKTFPMAGPNVVTITVT